MSAHMQFMERASKQSGVALLEVLVALLIFSIGIAGLMGMQAASMRTVSESKMRMEAAFWIDQLIGEMWVDTRDAVNDKVDVARLTARYAGTGGAGGVVYQRWAGRLTDTAAGGLPFPQPVPTALQPVVAVDAAGLVTITVFWQAPSDVAPRQLVTTTFLN